MKHSDRVRAFLPWVRALPLTWLNLARGIKLTFTALSYGFGTAGLWLLFPLTHNGATMFLPIVCACWLFRYRGMLVSLVLNGVIFQLSYLFLFRGLLPDQDFLEGGVIGFGTSLGVGLVVCWLRTAVDAAHIARQQARTAEHDREATIFKERQTTLAFEEQRKINALKDQFLLNVSHELRTPLTVLGGYLELLVANHEYLDSTKRTRMLKEALASQEELVALVDRVLSTTKVVSDIPIVSLEAVNIRCLLEDVLGHLAPQERTAYTINLQVSEQVMAMADPQFLRQVLRNLLANIFKYVPSQTEVRIEATQTDPASHVCLCVQDEGPGIPADELPLLFEKFVRLKRDLAGSTRGTGLGLYICKQLMEAMGGRIWVESSVHENMGSRFCLSLLPVPSQDMNLH